MPMCASCPNKSCVLMIFEGVVALGNVLVS